MWRKILVVNIVFWSATTMLLQDNANAQAPDTLWTKTFGGTSNDEAWSVYQTADGGFIIAGRTESFGAGNYDVYLIKTDSNGDTLWTRTFGGTSNDEAWSVYQTADGGFIIAGRTESFGAGNYDVYLIKTDSNGDTLWTKTFGGTDNDHGYSVCQTADGGFIITGMTYSFGAGNLDVYLIKTDSNGDTLWTKTIGGNGYEWGNSIQQTIDSGFIITGAKEFAASSYDVYLIRTDSNGDTVWTKTFGSPNRDFGRCVRQTADRDFIITGMAGFSLFGDVYLIRTDSNGNTIWTKIFGGFLDEDGWSVYQTADGGFIIAGFTASSGAGGLDVYLIKTDSNGNTLWTKTIGGTDSDASYSIYQTTDSSFIIAGKTKSFGAGGYDVYLIRLKASAAVEESRNERPFAYTYSYPVFPGICIEYTLPADMEISLKIYNITGTCINRLSKGKQAQGKHRVYWNGEADNGKKISSGIYFYSLSDNGLGREEPFELKGKIVLVR